MSARRAFDRARELSDVELRVMFEMADLTGTGVVDFNEFLLMKQQKRDHKAAKRAPAPASQLQ